MLKSEKYGHAVDWYALGAVLCASLLSKVNSIYLNTFPRKFNYIHALHVHMLFFPSFLILSQLNRKKNRNY